MWWCVQTCSMSIMWWANIVFTCFPIASFISYFFMLVADQVCTSVIGVLPWRLLWKVVASCNIFLVVTIILDFWMLHIIVCFLYCLIWINSRAHQNQHRRTIKNLSCCVWNMSFVYWQGSFLLYSDTAVNRCSSLCTLLLLVHMFDSDCVLPGIWTV